MWDSRFLVDRLDQVKEIYHADIYVGQKFHRFCTNICICVHVFQAYDYVRA